MGAGPLLTGRLQPVPHAMTVRQCGAWGGAGGAESARAVPAHEGGAVHGAGAPRGGGAGGRGAGPGGGGVGGRGGGGGGPRAHGQSRPTRAVLSTGLVPGL